MWPCVDGTAPLHANFCNDFFKSRTTHSRAHHPRGNDTSFANQEISMYPSLPAYNRCSDKCRLGLRRMSISHPQTAHLISIHQALPPNQFRRKTMLYHHLLLLNSFHWLVRSVVDRPTINEHGIHQRRTPLAISICWTEYATWFLPPNREVLLLGNWCTPRKPSRPLKGQFKLVDF